MRNYRRTFSLLGTVVVIFTIALPLNPFSATFVAAQDEKPKQETAQEEKARREYELGTMTVTAEKREENIQEIPASVSALSATQIEDAGITSTRDIDAYIPNFRFYHLGGRGSFKFMNIRGLSNTGIGDPSVSIYIDDVPILDFYAFYSTLYDIERIEVLRGPQGTLYGMNTEAGVVNIITKKPGAELRGSVTGEIGNYDSWNTRAGLSGPIIQDKLFLSFSGLCAERDGYIENIYDGKDIDEQETRSGRARLRWTPTDDWDIILTVSGEQFDDGGIPFVPKDKDQYRTMFGLDKNLDDFETWHDFKGETETKGDTESLRVSYSSPWFDVVSITARRYLDNDMQMDGDFTGLDMYVGLCKHEVTQWSQELRVSSLQDSGPFKWLAGGFYTDRNNPYLTGYEYGSAVMGGAFAGAKDLSDADHDDRTTAVFGQGTYRVLDEKLGLTAGLRYEYAERKMEREHYVLWGGTKMSIDQFYAMMGMPYPYSGTIDEEKSFTQWLPKFAIDYRFTPDFMTYASVAKGYKAGGFSLAVDNPQYVQYDAEIAWTYEAGIKSTWLNNRLAANLTGFYTDVDDYQDRIQLDPMTVIQANAAKARIMGIEAEVMCRPLPGLDLIATFGYIDPEYEDYTDPGTGKKYNGNTIILTPKYDLSLVAQYRFAWGLYLRGEVEGYSDFYFDRENQFKESAFELFHAKIGYETEHFDIYAFGKNLADKEYFINGYTDYGFVIGNTGTPMTYGALVTYRF